MVSESFTDITNANYLYNITSIDNLKSILIHGILSKNKVSNLTRYIDISNAEVQHRRDNVVLPNGKMLHDYANLYFNPRNAMLYSKLYMVNNLCILRVDKRILDIENIFISDRNAAVRGAKYMGPDQFLNRLNFNIIYSMSWDYDDHMKKMEYRALMMAEVLIYDCINPKFIIEVLVANEIAYEKVKNLNLPIDVKIEPWIFFDEGRSVV